MSDAALLQAIVGPVGAVVVLMLGSWALWRRTSAQDIERQLNTTLLLTVVKDNTAAIVTLQKAVETLTFETRVASGRHDKQELSNPGVANPLYR